MAKKTVICMMLIFVFIISLKATVLNHAMCPDGVELIRTGETVTGTNSTDQRKTVTYQVVYENDTVSEKINMNIPPRKDGTDGWNSQNIRKVDEGNKNKTIKAIRFC